MKSAAKKINSEDMTTPSSDEGSGAKETPASKGPSGEYEERSGPAVQDSKGWKGGYEDNTYLGNPSNIKDRQWADHGGVGYFGGDNIAWPENEVDAEIYMVPNFQEQSGQGANQSTLRPIGSV